MPCFSLGNKEGYGIQFWMSGLGSGILTPAEYDSWIAGKRDWNSPNVKKIFQLWKQANDAGLNTTGPNSTAMFMDAFTKFEGGKAANMIGLMSDVGGWHEMNPILGRRQRRRHARPRSSPPAPSPSLPYDGGIGYGVAKWTKDPALAADLVRSLTTTDALAAFSADAGAIAADTTVTIAGGGPAAAAITAAIKAGKPALHVALSAKTQEVMGRVSQQLLSGIDHRGRGGEAARRLRPGGLTSCRSEMLTAVGPLGQAGRTDAAGQPAHRRRAAGPDAGASGGERLAPYVLVAPAVLIIVVLPAVAAAARRQLLLHRRRRSQRGVGRPGQLRRVVPTIRCSGSRCATSALLVLLLPVAVAIPGLLATFIFLRVPGHRFFRSVYFFPAVLSPVIIGAIFNLLLGLRRPAQRRPRVRRARPGGLARRTRQSPCSRRRRARLGDVRDGAGGLPRRVRHAGRRAAGRRPGRTARHAAGHPARHHPGLSRTIQFVFVTTMIGMLTSMFGLLYVMTSGGPGGLDATCRSTTSGSSRAR